MKGQLGQWQIKAALAAPLRQWQRLQRDYPLAFEQWIIGILTFKVALKEPAP